MTTLGRRTVIGAAALGAGATLLGGTAEAAGRRTAAGLVRADRPVLTHGVQAGDPVGGQVTLWSRADRPARLVAEISRDPDFRRSRIVAGPVVTPDTDFTGRIPVRGLPSGERLHYRVTAVDLSDHRATSAAVSGSFRSGVADLRDISFIWSGDIAGQGWGVNPDLGGYRIADAMRAANADFFLSSGDNCYADGIVSPTVVLPDGRTWRNLVIEEKTAVSTTLADFRGQYRYNMMADNYRALLAETGIIAQWDDHEVLNNWYPGEILEGRAGYPAGTRVDDLVPLARQAFHEWIPVGTASPDRLGRVYRKLSFGPLLDLFILDMRSHKDPNTTDVETVDDGGILGAEQEKWLIDGVTTSRATWKVIANDLPLGLVVPDGTEGKPNEESISNGAAGAPSGREMQLARVLTAFQRAGVRNHVWLTADVHYTAAHHYSPDRAAYQDFDPFWEFVSGPLNAGGFGPNTLDPTFGPEAVFVAAPPRPSVSPLEGYQYFGQVAIDAESGELAVTLRGVDGAALHTTTLTPSRR
ncbi:MAG TPA: alkaline phosphatase D family protein [Nocardioides sp.]|nr:alkaline phosphatase D family protein [Nocardioides sp.]